MANSTTIGFFGGKFLPLHLGHVYAITQASTLVDELFIVLVTNSDRDKEICKTGNLEFIPPAVRLSWIGETFSNIDNIRIIYVEEEWSEDENDWSDGVEKIKRAINRPIDFVFSSEPSYDRLFRKYYPDTEHILIDEVRKNVPISATQIRNDVYGHWEKLPPAVRKSYVISIAVVGTESCGKSTLTKQLAKVFNTNFIEEVGRTYCERYSDRLTVDLFDDIAMEHYLLQRSERKSSNKLLFVDTEAVVTQYYLDMYFKGTRSQLIEEIIKKQTFDLILYLEPDVEWVHDGLRSAGEEFERTENNRVLKNMFTKRNIEFISISGTYKDRFEKAKMLVDDLLRGKEKCGGPVRGISDGDDAHTNPNHEMSVDKDR